MNTMNTRFFYLAILFLLFVVPFSCSDKSEEGDLVSVEEVKALLSPVNGYTSTLTLSATEYVEFKWEKSKVISGGGIPAYEVLFAKEGADFSNPIARIEADNLGKDNRVKVSHRQLDQILSKSGITEGNTGNLVWTVSTSLGMEKVISKEKNKIILTRSVPFLIPTELYITGDATEVGASITNAQQFTALSSGRFEIITKLKAAENYRIIDKNTEKGLRTFYIKDKSIEEGEIDSKVQKAAVYRIIVDFNTGSVVFEEIKNVKLEFCINHDLFINLKYQGLGVWKSEQSYLPLPNENWGKEERYKFKMYVDRENKLDTIIWGTKNATNSKPSGYPSYYHVKESWDKDTWADKWIFKEEYDKKEVVITLELQGNKQYTHSVEVVPLSYDWGEIANKASTTLANRFWNNSANHFYNNVYGQIRPYDYWPEAHALDVIIDAYERTGNEIYKQRISDFYNGIKAKNGGRFYNDFYDDMAWHGLAHLRAFKAIGDKRYEDSARDLWGWLTDGWNEEDGGGIPWNHQNNVDGKSKGVPTNGPSTIIAVRRWLEYGDAEIKDEQTNLQWAKKIYAWIRNHRFEPETGRVFERKDDKGGDWTYNAGTFMGAAMELYDVTKEKQYFDDAMIIADYAIENLSSNFYVLSDWAEQYNEVLDADHDVNLFKAIFVRYFTRLIMHEELPSDKRKQYIDFMENSAKCLWTRATLVSGSSVLFGHRWWIYPQSDKAIQLRTQTSGCAIMEAMALLEKKGYLSK